jgi:hypothetical protein
MFGSLLVRWVRILFLFSSLHYLFSHSFFFSPVLQVYPNTHLFLFLLLSIKYLPQTVFFVRLIPIFIFIFLFSQHSDFLFFDCQRWIELRKGGIGRGGNILIKIWGDLVLYFVFLPYTISIALRGLTSCRSDIRVGGGYSVCRSRYSTYLHLLCTPNSSTSPAT